VVKEREFKNLRLVSEDVAEFNYRPIACRKTYRMIVVRKNISVEKGEQVLFPDERYFFYITNESECTPAEVVFEANDRCNQENLIAQLKNGVRALHAPVDNLESNGGLHADDGFGLELEGVVGPDAAGSAGPLASETSRGKTVGAALGVQDFLECVHAVAVPDRQDRPQTGVPPVGLESAPVNLLPVA